MILQSPPGRDRIRRCMAHRSPRCGARCGTSSAHAGSRDIKVRYPRRLSASDTRSFGRSCDLRTGVDREDNLPRHLLAESRDRRSRSPSLVGSRSHERMAEYGPARTIMRSCGRSSTRRPPQRPAHDELFPFSTRRRCTYHVFRPEQRNQSCPSSTRVAHGAPPGAISA